MPGFLKSSIKLAIVVCTGSRVSVRGAVGWCCPETLRIIVNSLLATTVPFLAAPFAPLFWFLLILFVIIRRALLILIGPPFWTTCQSGYYCLLCICTAACITWSSFVAKLKEIVLYNAALYIFWRAGYGISCLFLIFLLK